MQYSKEELIVILNDLSSEGEEVRKTKQSNEYYADYISEGRFDAWRNKVLAFFRTIQIVPPEIVHSIEQMKNDYVDYIDDLQAQISTLISLIEKDYIDISSKENMGNPSSLEIVFKRFHCVARQLQTRYDDRASLTIRDEYDVQDLLHALLYLFFDDIRAEEWTPSYAGASARMDFLLKDIKTVIEVKKTRENMTSKDLGNQLIVDIERYKVHPDCNNLVCFVYDPNGILGNPTGIIKDLEGKHKDFLKVFIKPD